MTKLEQAARQALGALEVATTPMAKDRQEVLRAITTLREALSGVQALSAAPVRDVEREAFKAAHRHLELDEVPDAWGRPMFKHSHVEASWLGWIARAARAPADSVAAPAIGDELRDTLVAVSAAIAEQDDRTAQKMIREILAAAPAQAEQPDLTKLTERGAKAWAGVDAHGLRDGRWYMVDKDGAATLCVDEEDAKECAAHAFVAFPHMGPHRAVQLVEASTAGFTAADMATASAQGFRDGVASVAASAGWPKVSGVSRDEGHSRALLVFFAAEPTDDEMRAVHDTLAASPTPPAEQQATKETSGGLHVWRDISTAPKDGTRFVAVGNNYGLYSETQHVCVAQWFLGCWIEASDWNETSELKYLTHWMPLPPLPGNAARKQGASHDKT